MSVLNAISDKLETINDSAARLVHQVFPGTAPKSEAQQIVESIEKARSDLEQAESLFNELTDAQAIDFATYDILAARARYSYLIKLAKERGLHL